MKPVQKSFEFIDLSHTIADGLVTYPGLPAPYICDFWSREYSKDLYDDGSAFQIAKIEMVANTGTYIDVPFHRYEEGKDLSQILLSQLVDLPGIMIRVPWMEHLKIDSSFFINKQLKGKAVLIETGWSKHWNSEAYSHEHPYLTEDAACFLKEQGAVLVGIDSFNIDNSNSKSRPVHSILLGSDILIVEHLCNLHEINGRDFSFTALPPKIKGMGSFPVRAVAGIL